MEKVRTSLEVGFTDGKLPERFVPYRGKFCRAIPQMREFPFEDGQFDVVFLDSAAVSPVSIREAYRVLKTDGRLFFIVAEKLHGASGYTPSEVYSLVREGFHIIALERPSWWFLRRSGRTLTITAKKKKNWSEIKCRSFQPSFSRR